MERLSAPAPAASPPADRPAPAEPLLAVEDATLRFGGVTALDGVSFEVRAGELFAVIGPNGAGKTSIFNCINGVYRPQKGSIRLDGREIGGMPAHRVARSGIGLVFQHARPLQRQTVLENISLALLPDSLLRLAADPHVARRAKEIAERVGLGAVVDRRGPRPHRAR